MPGNRLGQRGRFLYTADDGVDYNYLTDLDLGSAMGAGFAPFGTPDLPRLLTPRYVLAEASDGAKKKVIAPTVDNTAYLSGGTVTVDGETFQITGRVGEKYTFGRFGNPAAGGGAGGGTP